MTDREKIIKGLECCRIQQSGVPPICEACPYKDDALGTCEDMSGLLNDAYEMLKAQEPIEARLHMCESCTKKYPECDAARDGIVFGCGVGNDNIIGCTAYVNRWKAQQPRVMTLEEVIKHYSLPPVFVGDLSAQEDYLQDIAPLYFDFPQCESWVVHWRGYHSVRKYLDDWRASYGMTWRCWTARPTDEQREAAKWDDA